MRQHIEAREGFEFEFEFEFEFDLEFGRRILFLQRNLYPSLLLTTDSVEFSICATV